MVVVVAQLFPLLFGGEIATHTQAAVVDGFAVVAVEDGVVAAAAFIDRKLHALMKLTRREARTCSASMTIDV